MSAAAVTVGELAGSKPRSRRMPYLVAFAAAAAGAGLGRAVTTTYLPVLLDRIADAPALIGAVMLVNAAAGLAVPLVVGVWSDRLRARGVSRTRPFVWGGSLITAGGLAATALGASSSYLVLALTGAVVYIGLNSLTTAHRALIPELCSPERRAKATSAQELAMLGGGLIGLAVGGALTGISLWAPFLLAAVLVPLLALPTLRRVSEQTDVAERERESRPFGYYLTIARRPGVRSFLFAQWLWVLGYAALPTFFVLYAERELNLSAATASVLLAGFGVGTGAATLAAGRAKTPERLRSMLLLGVVALGGGMLAVSLSTSLVSVAPALVVAALGFGLVNTVGFPLFSGLIPQGEAGGYTALFFSVRSISSAVALPAAGVVVQATGTYRALFVLGGAATLVALVPLLGGLRFRLRRPGRVGVVATLLATVPVLGLLVAQTGFARVDERAFEAINGLGPGPEWLWTLLDPHTRNYLALIALAVGLAAVTRLASVPAVFARVFVSALVAWGLLEAVYSVYDRPRPQEVVTDASLNGHSWAHLNSFPSGHMAITAALAVAAALAFPRLRHALWVYVAAVAVTRVMFGAHFPADVLAGTALGTASALLVAVAFERLRRRPQTAVRVDAAAAAAAAEPLPAHVVAAVMPSHNDLPTRALVEEVLEHVDTLLLVDDGSDQQIASELDRLATATGAQVLHRHERGGKGSAVRTGIDHLLATATPPQAVLVIDADGQHPASAIPGFLAAGATHELVIGDRFSDLRDMPLQRRLANRATGRLFQLTTGHKVRDTQNGMRLLRGRALETLPSGGYEAETAHLKRVLVAGLPVAWVPIPAIYADENSSFRAIRDGLRVLWAVVRPIERPVVVRRSSPTQHAPLAT